MRVTTRGLSLVELLVGLTLLAVVGSLFVRTALGMSRALGRLQTRAAAQSTLDAGATWLAAELEEAGPGDLLNPGSDTLRYRAVRLAGLACEVTSASLTLEVQRGATSRRIQPGRDSLFVFSDSLWRPFPVGGVALGSCGSADSLVPARVVEVMQARRYLSGGLWWLGARSESAGEGLQPLAGPFMPGPLWAWTGGSLRLALRDTSRADSALAFLPVTGASP